MLTGVKTVIGYRKMAMQFRRFTPSLISHLVVIVLAALYLASRIISRQVAPAVNLNLALTSAECPAVSAVYTQPYVFKPAQEIIKNIDLDPAVSDYSLLIPSSVKTVYIKPCDSGSFTLHGLSVATTRGQVQYALETGDLQCYNCQLVKQPDNSLNLYPLAAQPLLVINNLHRKIPYLLPSIFRPERYMPVLIFIAVLAVILVPFIRTVARFHIVSQALTLLIYFVHRWPKLYALFPKPLIGSQKIIGYSQIRSLPQMADTILFFTILAAFPVIVLLHFYLRRRRKRNLPNVILFNWFMVILTIYVVENAL